MVQVETMLILLCRDILNPRFTGRNYEMMSDYPPGEGHCGTNSPGWLDGPHPAIEDGQVPARVCFEWNGQDCRWETEISIVNCEDHFIYYLPDTPECTLRYCGM